MSVVDPDTDAKPSMATADAECRTEEGTPSGAPSQPPSQIAKPLSTPALEGANTTGTNIATAAAPEERTSASGAVAPATPPIAVSSGTVVLVRGLPGSGKSTVARAIASTYKSCVVEADDFFVNRASGVYVFDPSLISDAHQECQRRAKAAIRGKTPVVIVSNTFTQRWEMRTYVLAAVKGGYRVHVVDLYDGNKSDDILASRNVHGVPPDRIAAMRQRYEKAVATGLWDAETVSAFLASTKPHM
eukprot:TRINITY_DN60351_c0_g1_i1.p1 TRINITY_DN60351_c0_g1~~TRINITY_DN60351_c0_g1_i1.p1  ORF type:complete len:245 (+),score=24.21 TRINITY_DN60351_c0_g1_i1:71-805(+)